MISRNILFFTASMAMILTAGFTGAQTVEVSKELKVDVKGIKVDAQFTPQIQVGNVKDKRWKPKSWLEVDVEFEAKKAKVAGDSSTMVDSVEIKYFVGLNKQDKEGKYVMLTANITYLNVIEKEVQHAMAFASPAALERLLEKNSFSTADIKAVGVEIYRGGALAGFQSSVGGRWWEKLEQFAVTDGVLVPKAKTPFAPLWGDYDLETKQ